MMVAAFLSTATCFVTSIGPVSLSVRSTISPVIQNDSRPFNEKRATNLLSLFLWTAVATIDPVLLSTIVRNVTLASLSVVLCMNV